MRLRHRCGRLTPSIVDWRGEVERGGRSGVDVHKNVVISLVTKYGWDSRQTIPQGRVATGVLILDKKALR